MRVHLTFDIEVWCNGWDHLDREFPACYSRYVEGRSKHGDYALPKTLEILARHGLHGVFFVEPLFSARFGAEYLDRIVRMIDDAGQEVQLHLHPEWTDEIEPPPISDVARKRQHLIHYTLAEQTALVGYAKGLLEAALGRPVDAFRSGSYAANADTFAALAANGIAVDSSVNTCYEISAPQIVRENGGATPFSIHQVAAYPVSVFRDGFGKPRPAQVGACSFAEMRGALESARRSGWSDFVIVSHNFEMLKPGTSAPDWIVARRFESLCRYLAAHRDELPTIGFDRALPAAPPKTNGAGPKASASATAWRFAEQIARRIAH